MACKYIGKKGGVVRLGDRPVMPGEIIEEPPDLVDALLLRLDFEEVPTRKPASKKPASKKAEGPTEE